MVNYLFIFLFIIGLIYGIFSGRVELISSAVLDTPKEALLIFFNIIALLLFWSGILEIWIRSGLLKKITKLLKIVIRPIFKELPKDCKALDYISANFAANMIGVGNAATPFGLKAMEELDNLNNHNSKPSKAMISLIVINTSGLCLIPTSIIALRKMYGSNNASIILPFVIIVTLITTIFSILLNEVFKRVF